MNEIDQKFEALAAEIRGLSEKEIYYRIRKHFDQVPREIQKSCMDFFNQFNYWGRLDPEKGVYEEIEEKGQALFAHMEDFVWLYHHLGDYRSKKTLYAILNNWYRYDFTTTARPRSISLTTILTWTLSPAARRRWLWTWGRLQGTRCSPT